MLNASSERLRRAQGLSSRPAPQHPAARTPDSEEGLIVPSDELRRLDFARDCGASDGLAIRVEPSGAPPQDLAVPSGLVLVGRGDRCTLQIPGAGVADKHLFALFLQGQFFVCDLGTPGGTWLGSRRVTSSWVPAGSALRVGDARLVLEGALEAEEADESPGDVSDDESLADELWLSYPRTAGDQRYRLDKSVTLFGRDSRCRVRIENRSVSRFHCVLVKTTTGVWVADLASREGIRINGERVGMARIDDDCELTIGATRVQLHRGTETAAPEPQPVHFQAAPAGHMSEEFVRELLAEFRQTQRETLAEMGALLRDVLRAGAPAPGAAAGNPPAGSSVESLIQRIESRLGGLG